MRDPRVVDNFLPSEEFKLIEDIFLNDAGPVWFPWYFADYVGVRNPEKHSDGFYFMHNFYDSNNPIETRCSEFIYTLEELIFSKMGMQKLIRAKANLFPKTQNLITYQMHIDQDEPHKGAIFYLNTCNGFTVLGDGTKIDSIANRMLFFDSSKPHASTNCTDVPRRVNFNINYL